MEDMKVTDKRQEIGYYSGVVVKSTDIHPYGRSFKSPNFLQDSIFAVCQLFTILQWGRLSGWYSLVFGFYKLTLP